MPYFGGCTVASAGLSNASLCSSLRTGTEVELLLYHLEPFAKQSKSKNSNKLESTNSFLISGFRMTHTYPAEEL